MQIYIIYRKHSNFGATFYLEKYILLQIFIFISYFE